MANKYNSQIQPTSLLYLTKSLFVKGRQCKKALYLHAFHSDLCSQPTSLERKTIVAGELVGQAAREKFPNGLLIEAKNSQEAIQETKQAIDDGVLTLFEAAFSYNNVFIRVDILSRKTTDSPWDFYEVKATTYNKCTEEQKEEYRNDIAIQVWVLQNLEIPLRKISLMHLNRECRYPDLAKLFEYEDYSDEIISALKDIENNMHFLRTTLTLSAEPQIQIGAHCDKPRACSFRNYCKKDIPKPSIFNIPDNRRKWGQFERGMVSVNDLKASDFKTEVQKRALQCYQENQHFFDPKIVSEMLNLWKYPLTYLDFEAIDHAIPRYPGARPYQHIPFQFSCHIQRNADAALEHAEFLWKSEDDPRPAFIQELLNKVPSEGSIIVYYAPYESTRLKELAEDFPEFSKKLTDIRNRLVDLMVVIEKGVYYPEFMGSFSIKKVAPAILGEDASYANLEISNGVEAMLAFDKIITLPEVSEKKQILRQSMLDYCKQDTLLMVRLHQWLFLQSKKGI